MFVDAQGQCDQMAIYVIYIWQIQQQKFAKSS